MIRSGKIRGFAGIALLSCLAACSSDRNPAAGAQQPDTSDAGDAGASGCTRTGLSHLVDAYFDALSARDPTTLPFADDVKFTENTRPLQIGDGFWQTAGALEFRRDLVEADRCATVTQAVVDEGGSPIIFALRLETVAGRITEIETIVVRGQGADSIWFNPQVIADTPQPEWESALPKEDRSTREELVGLADRYFQLFVDGDVASFPFTDDCNRYEDGLLTTSSGGCPAFITPGGTITGRRYPVADVERGVVAGFALAEGAFLDLHMFKVTGGKVERIQAVMTSQIDGSTGTGWN